MPDKEKLKELEELKKACMYSKDNYTDEDRKALCDGCKEECKFNKKEEPVSEELEKEMNDFFLTMQVQDKEYINEDTFRSIARHFANWQKEQIIKRLCNHTNIDQMVEKFEDKYKPEKVLDTEYYKRGIFDTIKAIKED